MVYSISSSVFHSHSGKPMHILKSIRIEGLWGENSRKITFDLDPSFNFLIGENGTGKTSVINLTAAALSADFDRLDKIQFSKLTITLKAIGSNRRPYIEVVKQAKKDVPYYDIEYRIGESANSKPLRFDLDALAEERFFRGVPPRVLRERVYRQKFLDVQNQLRTLIRVCWLSVHRHTDDERGPDERRHVPAVDRKLSSLHNELVRYFSQLARTYSDQTKEFQKKSFLSMLTSERETDVLAFAGRIDIEQEKQTLAHVFEVLGVKSQEYANQLRTHFTKFDAARKSAPGKTMKVVEFAALFNAWKTHSLVQHYAELDHKRKEIFSGREVFLQVINEMFGSRKIVSISDRNELVITTSEGKPIAIEELSSGEKQLLIILGEALLQQGDRVIYIADEPELSLHVRWQEQLTGAITKLNPNAQILFATHSPDIVGIHSKNIVDMETLVA